MKMRKRDGRMAVIAGRCVAVLSLVAIGALIVIPNYMSPPRDGRSRGCVNACINMLRQIDGAKEQYYLENLDLTDAPAMSRLVGPDNYIKTEPRCPAGGRYTIGARETPPVCSIATHVLR